MSDLYALPTGDNSCALLMLLGSNHYEILWYCWMNDPHLARYYFMMQFELTPITRDYSSQFHYYIESLEFGDPTENEAFNGGKSYPIRANLRINVRTLNALRQPFIGREGPSAFPEFITLER